MKAEKKDIKTAINEVFESLMSMDEDDFEREVERHTDGEVAHFLMETGALKGIESWDECPDWSTECFIETESEIPYFQASTSAIFITTGDILYASENNYQIEVVDLHKEIIGHSRSVPRETGSKRKNIIYSQSTEWAPKSFKDAPTDDYNLYDIAA